MFKRAISIIMVMALLVVSMALPVWADNEEEDIYLEFASKSIFKGASVKNELVGASGKVRWTSSNKKIASVTKGGVIKGRSFGKCVIKAKYQGKTYKCNIKVIRRTPDFDAEIVDVGLGKRRCFVKVRFRNHSNKKILIKPKAKYDDFTSVTYKVKTSSSKGAVIKGKKSKTVTFYNYGKRILYNYAGRKDPDIFAFLQSQLSYTFVFDGKKYPGCTYWYEDEEDMDYYYDSLYFNGKDSVDTEAKYR